MTKSARDHRLVLAVVLAATLPYVFTIGTYFIQDDFGVVQVLTRRPWTTFPRWFFVPWTENTFAYTPDELRPFVALSYQLTGKWTPGRPELHHVINIAIHVGNALLVMGIARAAIGLAPAASAFAGIIFAILPGQAESVAWVTGRVDSMPALFYLATFLAYARWRRERRWRAYALALALFFAALFSKQNTITMVATLAAYDVFVLARRDRGPVASAALAWIPFATLTAAFLALRHWVFGASLRAGPRNAYEIQTIVARVGHHLQRTLTGQLQPVSSADVVLAIAIGVGLLVVLFGGDRHQRVRFIRGLACFAVVWMAIGLAPTALAGYESPRHAYLASAGWGFALAILLDSLLARASRPAIRHAIAASAAALVILYGVRLVPVVQGWRTAGRISLAAASRLQAEAARAVPGTLILAGVPVRSWEYSAPFPLQTPFAPEELTSRVRLITKWRLHCCGTEHWDAYTRRQVRAWLEASPRPPVLVVRFAPETAAASRITDREFPELQQIVPELLSTGSSDELDNVIGDILERLAAGHAGG